MIVHVTIAEPCSFPMNRTSLHESMAVLILSGVVGFGREFVSRHYRIRRCSTMSLRRYRSADIMPDKENRHSPRVREVLSTSSASPIRLEADNRSRNHLDRSFSKEWRDSKLDPVVIYAMVGAPRSDENLVHQEQSPAKSQDCDRLKRRDRSSSHANEPYRRTGSSMINDRGEPSPLRGQESRERRRPSAKSQVHDRSNSRDRSTLDNEECQGQIYDDQTRASCDRSLSRERESRGRQRPPAKTQGRDHPNSRERITSDQTAPCGNSISIHRRGEIRAEPKSRERHRPSTESQVRDHSNSRVRSTSDQIAPRGISISGHRRGETQGEPKSRERHRPSPKSQGRDRSNSRDRSTQDNHEPQGGSHANNRGKAGAPHHRSISKERGLKERSRSRSCHREHTDSQKESEVDHNSSPSILPSTIRRRRMSDLERSKRSCSRSPSGFIFKSKGDIERSSERKSSVIASVDSFLDEGEAKASLSGKFRDERSGIISVSKIQRRKSKSLPTGSVVSVFGGQVIGSQDKLRERRRSGLSSQGPLVDITDSSDTQKETQKQLSGKSSTRSRTPSARTRRVVKRTTTDDSGAKPSSDSRLVRSPSQRQRKVTPAPVPEVAPSLPELAVVANVQGDDIASSGRTVVNASVATKKNISDHQHRGEIAGDRPRSSSSLGAMEGRRSSRRKYSFDGSSPDHDRSPNEGSSGRDTRLSLCLERLSGSDGAYSRRKSSDKSVATAPALSDKHRKRPTYRTMSKATATLKSERDPSASLLSSISKDKKEKEKETPNGSSVQQGVRSEADTTYSKAPDDLHSSTTSLDPSVLSKGCEHFKMINSADELFFHALESDEDTEGELELNDSATQATQMTSSSSYRRSQGAPTAIFESAQLREHDRSIDPGSPSTHSSGHSWTSDSLRRHGILKRPAGEVPAESSSLRSERVSWVELPLASPGMILVKSSDDDGTNEHEAMTSAASLSSIEDWNNESKLSEAIKNTKKIKNEERMLGSKSSPSLGAALDHCKEKRKRHSADERTLGTTATSTSEATMKTENKSGISTALHNSSKKSESDRGVTRRKSGSGRLETSLRSSRSSFSSKGESCDRSTSGRKASRDEVGQLPERVVLPRRRSGGPVKKSFSDTVTGEDRQGTNRKPLRRTSSSTAAANLRMAEPRVESTESYEDQSSGEPTAELSPRGGRMKSSLQSSPVSTTRTFRKVHRLVKDATEKVQRARSSSMNGLESFLARMGGGEKAAGESMDRSVKSESLSKRRAKPFLVRSRVDADDRSISSAPMQGNRRKRHLLAMAK
jgi:hypothetical protein